MRLTLAATDEALAAAWRRECGHFPDVSVHQGSILELDVDAIVSPANSFGFMEGGIDAIYRRSFGDHVQERLQALLRAQHDGELPVGRAEIIAVHHARIRYLISAPTMRVPMRIEGTVYPYLAARAALRLVKQGHFAPGSGGEGHVSHAVVSLAMPGLGTGTGGVAPEACAAQVRAAIEEVMHGRVPRFANLAAAVAAHEQLARRSS